MRSSGVCGLSSLEPCLFCPAFLPARVAAATAIFSWLWMCFSVLPSNSGSRALWFAQRDTERERKSRQSKENRTHARQISRRTCIERRHRKAERGKQNSRKANLTKRGASQCSLPLCASVMLLWVTWMKVVMERILSYVTCDRELIEVCVRGVVNRMHTCLCGAHFVACACMYIH